MYSYRSRYTFDGTVRTEKMIKNRKLTEGPILKNLMLFALLSNLFDNLDFFASVYGNVCRWKYKRTLLVQKFSPMNFELDRWTAHDTAKMGRWAWINDRSSRPRWFSFAGLPR